MASIYRPYYTDPKTGKRKRGRTYRIAYINEAGRRVTTGGFTDKTATLSKANALERNAQRAQAGLPVAQAEQLRKPIAELSDLYVEQMQLAGLSEAHIKETNRLLVTLWKECEWTCLAEIRAEKLMKFLASKQQEGRGTRTINSYRDALKTFVDWCKGQHWIEENPISHVRKARSKGKKHKPRRAYTTEEFQTLIKATPSENRRQIYQIAGLSGLRRGELQKLERRDLSPTGKRPTWHLRAEITKGRRLDKVPMLPDVVPIVLPLWEAIDEPTGRLFPTWPRHQTLDQDIKRAKIKKIDSEGKCVDFHSLRYFFCTLLGRTLPIQKVKVLMRHKNIRETADLYMNLCLEDVGEEIWTPPTLLPQKPNSALQ
jgi:integrase